jgi:DNA (cytosine-5)-methyltransferase 1
MKAAELCAGYGGLAVAIEEVFNAKTVWVSEFEEAPSKILAHRWPSAPNHGDMTKINWYGVETVDVLGAGTPCQDLSTAGKRKGMTEGTRSNLWVNMREAIAAIKPTYVVWENVRGAYSAEADSDLEQCEGCVGDPDGRVVLRALGRVLGDLSDLGYDCQWRGLRAADVGSCHSRFRVFVLAVRRDALPHASRIGGDQAIEHDGGFPAADDWASLLDESSGDTHGLGSLRKAIANGHFLGIDGGRERAEQDGWGQLADGRTEAIADTHGRDDDGRLSHSQRCAERGEATSWSSQGFDWQEYEPAIRHWEARLGRPAPRPTEPTGRDGAEQLSARFCEWMMGLPDGWVTDPAIGISRNEQLKACGNGVVPQQAAAALRDMLAAFTHEGLEAA